MNTAMPAATHMIMNNELCDAARDGDYITVLRLIREGADVNLKNAAGGTPLHYVLNWASHNHSRFVEVVKMLLEKGADVNAKCKSRRQFE